MYEEDQSLHYKWRPWASELHGLSFWAVDFNQVMSAIRLCIHIESDSNCFLGFLCLSVVARYRHLQLVSLGCAVWVILNWFKVQIWQLNIYEVRRRKGRIIVTDVATANTVLYINLRHWKVSACMSRYQGDSQAVLKEWNRIAFIKNTGSKTWKLFCLWIY